MNKLNNVNVNYLKIPKNGHTKRPRGPLAANVLEASILRTGQMNSLEAEFLFYQNI